MKKTVLVFSIIAAAVCVLAGLPSAAEVGHGGDIVYTKPVKSVVFSHKTHVENKGLSCDMCHPKPFEPKALKAQGKSDFTMKSLYEGKYCGACHDGRTAFPSNAQCARCHGGVKEFTALQQGPRPVARGLKGPEGVISLGTGSTTVKFSHEIHAQGATCADCHSGNFQMKKGTTRLTMADHAGGNYCYSCHNGKKAFDYNNCAGCHTGTPMPKEDLVFKIKDPGAVRFSHEFHTKVFGCKECHPAVWPMKKTAGKMNMDRMYQGMFCGKCHDDKTAFSSMQCDKCHSAPKTAEKK